MLVGAFGDESSDNCSARDSLPSGSGLNDADLDKLALALVKRVRSPAGFHYFEFLLGVIVTVGLGYLLYRRRRERLLHRHRESDAVELLKNMDDEAIKRILGDSHLPSWINFPDFERVGWLNEIMSQLWPSINAAISHQFREMLGPLLRENKPSWIASLKLFRFDLGDVAPYANGVKIYKQDVDSKDQVLMEVDFSWIGEQDVQLDIKPIPKHLGPLSPAGHLLSSIIRLRAGIERITVNGRVRFIWRPLLDELPVIGGMQVALVGMPSFSFDVTLFDGDVSLVPGLEAWLTQFMKDTVFRPYILPERYMLPFSEAAENEGLRPSAILLVTMMRAVNVPKMDIFSASDPYCRMFIRNSVQMRTTTKQNNANPEWNEDFKFLVHDIETQEFTIILMDYDEMNPDDTIGRCCIPIRDMECSKTKEYWLSLDMDSEISDAPEVKAKNAGVIDTLIAAEQRIADAGDKAWKKLPGVRQKGEKKCQIQLQCTFYKLESDDIESLVEEHKKKTAAQQPSSVSRKHPDSSVIEYEDADSESSESSDSELATTEERHAKRKADRRLENGHAPGHQDQNATKRAAGNPKEVTTASRESDRSSEDKRRQADEVKEKQRQRIEGKTVKKINEGDLRERAKDALAGGILEIRPKKAVDLVRKPWYKASFLRSAAQLEANVCGQFKRTASVSGSQPVFNESMEFVLGGHDLEDLQSKRLKLEVWDHKMHLNHFRGGCSLDLKHIIQAQRISKTVKLSGVRRGELSLEVLWIPAHASANKHTHTRS